MERSGWMARAWRVGGGGYGEDRNLGTEICFRRACNLRVVRGAPKWRRKWAEMAPKWRPKFGTEISRTEIRDRNFWGPKFGTEIKGLEKCKKHWKYGHFETEVEDRNFIPEKC